MELTPNQLVNLTIGRQAKVIEELGRGGQGIVYRVELDGNEWALKWYLKSYLDSMSNPKTFYDNLANNICKGAPNDSFLWPEFLTEMENDSFGYLMKLRPKEYYEFSHFMLANVQFKSFAVAVTAGIKICESFAELHMRGCSYQDINAKNFFINPSNGDVLICDNDNVMPQGESSGIGGMMGYVAPEVVLGKSKPDKYSDRFSLAIVLFILLYGNHPFQGAKYCGCACLTGANERRIYGSDIVFMFDKDDTSNRPVRGVHTNVIRRWPLLPKILKDTFIREFSKECIDNPLKRMVDMEWVKLLQNVLDMVVECPHCHKKIYAESEENLQCRACNKNYKLAGKIQYAGRNILLTPGTTFNLEGNGASVDGRVIETSGTFKYQIKNESNNDWLVSTPSGRLNTVSTGMSMPIKTGLKMSINGINADVLSFE